MSFWSSLFGGDDGKEAVIPEWWQDEYYGKAQETLYPFGKNLLEGNIPSYYVPIGEWGGAEFEDIMSLLKGDATKSSLEGSARLGQRGGAVTSKIAKTVGDLGRKLRFEDFTRAMRGREFLLNTGLNTLSGVRDSSLNLTGMRNNFNLSTAGIQNEWNTNQQNREDAMWSSILSSGIGALSNAYGYSQLSGMLNNRGSASGGVSNSSAYNQTPGYGFDYDFSSF